MSDQVFEASAPEEEPITSASVRNAVTRKQNFNIFTVMLIIAFFCLLLGTLLMLRELQQFGGVGDFPWRTSGATPTQVGQ